MHNCTEIAPLLSAYVDLEATVTEQSVVEQAVSSCTVCENRLQELRATSALLSSRLSVPVEEPVGLWERLSGAIASSTPAASSAGGRIRKLSVSWAAILLVLLTGMCYAVYQHTTRPFDPAGVYQPSNERISVKTDNLQRAVEWAEQETGFRLSPLSLASRGYYLTGVTIEKVDGLPLACFDYRDKRGERITIFQTATSRPLKGIYGFCPTGPPMITVTRDGRSLRAWQHGSNSYIIMGTMPDSELRYLAETAASACY